MSDSTSRRHVGRDVSDPVVQALLNNPDVLQWTRKRKGTSHAHTISTASASTAYVSTPGQWWSRDGSSDTAPRSHIDDPISLVRVRSLISDGRATGYNDRHLSAVLSIPSITEAEEVMQQRLADLRAAYMDRARSITSEGGAVIMPPDDVLLSMPPPSPSPSPLLALPPLLPRPLDPPLELEPAVVAGSAADRLPHRQGGVVVCPHCGGVSAETLHLSAPPVTRPPMRVYPDPKLDSFVLPKGTVPRALIDAVIAEAEVEMADDQQVLVNGCGPERVSILAVDYPSCTRTQSSLCEETVSYEYMPPKYAPQCPASHLLLCAHTDPFRVALTSRATRRRCKRRCYGKGEFQVMEYECMRFESKAKFNLGRAVWRAAHDGLSPASQVRHAYLAHSVRAYLTRLALILVCAGA